MNIPTISTPLFKRHERQIGPALEEAAKDSCTRASQEERNLHIENMEKICELLPDDIAKDIYGHLKQKNGTSLHEHTREDFDAVLVTIMNSTDSYDMGWSKRGYGRSYDSLNGYGTIIGFLTGKILDYRTRNRKCKFFDLGHSKEDHDCRPNFRGSAKAMEPDVGAELVNESSILKEVGLNVRVVVGDEDTSTSARIRSGTNRTVYKLSDSYHLKKNFTKELYKMQVTFKEMGKSQVIPHLKKCFTIAIHQNMKYSIELAKALNVIPDHMYGSHKNCGNCNHK
ncbi:hypothetical protein JTB14_033366 [Gonioctena quinquepunctata]|nr:hypothetical protein JTB14_033366 [Gonioctena quinquepunctata]